MKTELSGGFTGTSHSSMTVSLLPSAGQSGMGSIYRTATTPPAKSERQFAMHPSPPELGYVYWDARSATPQRKKQTSFRKRLPKWKDREYRQGYLEGSIEQGIAWQIRVNRKMRGWSQEDLAVLLGTHQSAVSRMEDTTYGSHSVETLLSVANAFDCGLVVKFVPFSEIARLSEDLSPEAMLVEPFAVEASALE
jgi:hypothetical protein